MGRLTMPLRAIPTGTTYCVEVSVEQFTAVEKYEAAHLITPGFLTILDRLNAHPGVRDIEYNGHFGPNYFFWLDAEHAEDIPLLVTIIETAVVEALAT